MRQWFILYKKEITEMVRNYKIIWIPIVFILIGIMQPISYYYMPEILDSMGNLPAGTVLEMPIPTAAETLLSVLSNYGMLGVLILVLSAMGIVSSERQSGVVTMVMMKPVSHASYILSKWAGLVTITFMSFVIGYLASWYYTDLLIGSVAVERIIQSICIYSIWLLFIVTLTLLFSTIMRGYGSTAFLSILAIISLSLTTSFFSEYMKWSPAKLTDYTGQLLMGGELNSNFPLTFITTIASIIAILFLSVQIFKKQEIA